MNSHAGFWIRLGANLLDALIVSLPLTIIFSLFFGLEKGDNWVTLILNLYSLILPVFFNGKTIGKHICGIRIAKKETYEAPSIWNMIMRNIIFSILAILSVGILIILDILFVIFREDKRSMHDIIAGTVVAYE